MSNFAPDSPLVHSVVASPNHGEREPDMILLHYTGMPDTRSALELLCSPRQDLGAISSHYVVSKDGQIIQLVPEARRAWHAGVSSWAGSVDVNSSSIGIELDHPGHEIGSVEFPDEQIEAVIALCRDITTRHDRIQPNRILAHSDVTPGRKRDPGETFPWAKLHASGIGHWVPPAPITHDLGLATGDRGKLVASLQANLCRYGYGIAVTGIYDLLTKDVVEAFQRHFRPARVDGIADASTVATLQELLAAVSLAHIPLRTRRTDIGPVC